MLEGCELTEPLSMILDMGLILTYVSLLTAIHAGLALLQARLWRVEKIWDAKKIFFLSLIYFPIGFLGFRAWRVYKLKKSYLETAIFAVLLILFFYFFWAYGFHNANLDRAIQMNFGLENPECLSPTWPFATPIWFLSYLCNLLVFHHLAWPFFELSFWGLKKIRVRSSAT